MYDQLVQNLLNRIRPSVHGRQRGGMQRYFHTSDVLQEAAIQIIGEIDKRDAEGLEVNQSWLNRVGRGHANRLIRFHSAQKRSTEGERHSVEALSSDSPQPDGVAEKKEIYERLFVCLGMLEETQRNIIHQYQVEGKSFREIGTTMSRPEHWVRRQFHATLKQLKSMLMDSTPVE